MPPATATDILPEGQEAPPAGEAAPQGQKTPPAGAPPAGEAPPEGQETPPEGEEASAELQDFAMPEGVELDTELAGELKTFAKEHGLKQEQAQQVADLGAKMLQKQQDAFSNLRKEWETQSRQDKEFGGEAFEKNLASMNKVLGQFATPEFLSFLEESGLGQHPEMLRVWHRIASAVDEDKLVTGSPAGASGEKTLEERLYPSMTK